MKRIASIFLSVIVVFTMIPEMVFATENQGASSTKLEASVGIPDYLSFKAVGKDMIIGMEKRGNPEALTLEYSFDPSTVTWEEFTAGTSKVTIPENQTVYFRAKTAQTSIGNKNYSNYWCFAMNGSGSVEAGGNVMSLLDPTCSVVELEKSHTFINLFKNCIVLTKAPNLPAEVLTSSCYEGMFSGCMSLTKAPDLPAEKLANSCYTNMFSDCITLIEVSELSAKILEPYCYMNMFSECMSLEKAPSISAETLSANCCRLMFNDCLSLKTPPELQAESLELSCYAYMFCGCISLEEAPKLPAKNLVESCYEYMFEDCSSLKKIEVGFTDWNVAGGSTLNWVSGVNANADFTFICPSELSLNNMIPENWIVDNECYYTVYSDRIEHTARRFSAWLPPIQCTLSGH